MGSMSASRMPVVRLRTPQEMSKPTPPAETTPPRSGSNAATPPMGKPYPQWASGMTWLAPTIPGSMATLHACSATLSSISRIRAASA
jgi:hypothetical protein